jgi:excisionase family DNA binding protein
VDLSRPRALEGSRPTLDELIRAILSDELRPFVAMLHELMTRLGRAAQGADEFLSVAEAADVAHVGKSTIRAWIKQGRLKAGRMAGGRLVRILRSDLTALATQEPPGKRPDPEQEAAKILERNRPTER